MITKNKINSIKNTEIEQARCIMRSLGPKVAIRYLQLRNWTMDSVLWILYKLEEKHEHLRSA
jgi:hypothetical protein